MVAAVNFVLAVAVTVRFSDAASAILHHKIPSFFFILQQIIPSSTVSQSGKFKRERGGNAFLFFVDKLIS